MMKPTKIGVAWMTRSPASVAFRIAEATATPCGLPQRVCPDALAPRRRGRTQTPMHVDDAHADYVATKSRSTSVALRAIDALICDHFSAVNPSGITVSLSASSKYVSARSTW